MKKLIVLVVLVAMATAAFGQRKEREKDMVSSTKLYEMRAEEIKEARKGLRKGVQIEPAELARIDSFYLPRIRVAEEREFALALALAIASAPTAPTAPVIRKTTSYVDRDTAGRVIEAEASSETPVNLGPPVPTAPENKRAARGANLIFQGSNGGYSGRSSVPVAAEAYNSSRMTEAIATAIETSAQPAAQASSGGQTTAPTTSVPTPQTPHGYVGFMRNNARHEVEIRIVGLDNPYFLETHTVPAGKVLEAYLPAGNYRFFTKLKYSDQPTIAGEKLVGNPMSVSVLNGMRYWWSVTQPY